MERILSYRVLFFSFHERILNSSILGCLTPKYFGVIHPSSDGRVIFMLPYESTALVGTTDSICETEFQPTASKEHVDFLLKELEGLLHPDIKRKFLLSSENSS